MVTAFALISVERHRLAEVAERLIEVDGIAEVYSVAGEYDYVAVLRVPRYEDMSGVVTEGLAKVEGVVDTETLMAFRCYFTARPGTHVEPGRGAGRELIARAGRGVPSTRSTPPRPVPRSR